MCQKRNPVTVDKTQDVDQQSASGAKTALQPGLCGKSAATWWKKATPWGPAVRTPQQAQRGQISILTGFLPLPGQSTHQPEGQVLLGLGGTTTHLHMSTSF